MIKHFNNITAHGQTYLAPDMPPSNLFWVDPKGHENFWCSVQGGTSGSSTSPRTEMRETWPDTSESFEWGFAGSHRMTGWVRLEVMPSYGKVIVAQVHAKGAPNPFLMVTWWNGVARIDYRENPYGDARKMIAIPCSLSQAFGFDIHIEDGFLDAGIGGQSFGEHIDPDWQAFPFYFKRGAYVIDHEGPAEEGGWVVYEESSVAHCEAAQCA